MRHSSRVFGTGGCWTASWWPSAFRWRGPGPHCSKPGPIPVPPTRSWWWGSRGVGLELADCFEGVDMQSHPFRVNLTHAEFPIIKDVFVNQATDVPLQLSTMGSQLAPGFLLRSGNTPQGFPRFVAERSIGLDVEPVSGADPGTSLHIDLTVIRHPAPYFDPLPDIFLESMTDDLDLDLALYAHLGAPTRLDTAPHARPTHGTRTVTM
jgi:hypothetical protein